MVSHMHADPVPVQPEGTWHINEHFKRFRVHMHEFPSIFLPLVYESANVLGTTKTCPCVFASYMNQWFEDHNIDRKMLCMDEDKTDFTCPRKTMSVANLRLHLDQESKSCPAHFLVRQYLMLLRSYYSHRDWTTLGQKQDREGPR